PGAASASDRVGQSTDEPARRERWPICGRTGRRLVAFRLRRSRGGIRAALPIDGRRVADDQAPVPRRAGWASLSAPLAAHAWWTTDLDWRLGERPVGAPGRAGLRRLDGIRSHELSRDRRRDQDLPRLRRQARDADDSPG